MATAKENWDASVEAGEETSVAQEYVAELETRIMNLEAELSTLVVENRDNFERAASAESRIEKAQQNVAKERELNQKLLTQKAKLLKRER